MAADGIVEAVDVTADCACGFDPALEDGAPDEFGLEGLEERLDHGVVEAVALARHRDRDAVLSQLSLVLDGAVLAATVCVVNEPGGMDTARRRPGVGPTTPVPYGAGRRRPELCWILGDGVDQAADISWVATSIPSRNFTPRTIFGN